VGSGGTSGTGGSEPLGGDAGATTGGQSPRGGTGGVQIPEGGAGASSGGDAPVGGSGGAPPVTGGSEGLGGAVGGTGTGGTATTCGNEVVEAGSTAISREQRDCLRGRVGLHRHLHGAQLCRPAGVTQACGGACVTASTTQRGL
jgi:hypothetical protein